MTKVFSLLKLENCRQLISPKELELEGPILYRKIDSSKNTGVNCYALIFLAFW